MVVKVAVITQMCIGNLNIYLPHGSMNSFIKK